MTPELIQKAKECKSVEELLALAKENNAELTLAEAEAYFAQLHNEGELSDDELDGAAGGSCHKKDGRMVVTVLYRCEHYACHKCGLPRYDDIHRADRCQCDLRVRAPEGAACKSCKYMSYEKGLRLCNHEANMK